MVQLDIISDVICPWCYIGKARFDRAFPKLVENGFVVAAEVTRSNGQKYLGWGLKDDDDDGTQPDSATPPAE